MTEVERLAERFRKQDGLVDVRFYIEPGASSAVDVCAEVNRLFEAADAGECSVLDFGDLTTNRG